MKNKLKITTFTTMVALGLTALQGAEAGNVKKTFINVAKEGAEAQPSDIPANYGNIGNVSKTLGYNAATGVHGTWQDGAVPTLGKLGNAVALNGSAKIGMPHNSVFTVGGNQLTMAAWIKTTSTTSENIIVNKESSYEMAVHSDGIFRAAIETDGYEGQYNYWWWFGNTKVNDGKWHHVATVYDGTVAKSVKLYVDGLNVYTVTNYYGNVVEPGRGLGIGARGLNSSGTGGGNFFQGHIDEVQLFKKALTDSEIKSIMNNPLSVQDKMFGYWPMD